MLLHKTLTKLGLQIVKTPRKFPAGYAAVSFQIKGLHATCRKNMAAAGVARYVQYPKISENKTLGLAVKTAAAVSGVASKPRLANAPCRRKCFQQKNHEVQNSVPTVAAVEAVSNDS